MVTSYIEICYYQCLNPRGYRNHRFFWSNFFWVGRKYLILSSIKGSHVLFSKILIYGVALSTNSTAHFSLTGVNCVVSLFLWVPCSTVTDN